MKPFKTALRSVRYGKDALRAERQDFSADASMQSWLRRGRERQAERERNAKQTRPPRGDSA